MNARTQRSSTIRPRSRAATMLAATMMLLLALLPMLPGPASAQVVPNQLFLSATILPINPAIAVIHGDGFTPGGSVQIVFTDNSTLTSDQQVWTVASEASYGPYGSQDPAQGYVPAGSVSIAIPLGGTTIYGPNGSQDPAQGYVAGDQSFAFALCGQDAVIQAYDSDTKTWSNRVDVVASDSLCALFTDDATATDELPPSPRANEREQEF